MSNNGQEIIATKEIFETETQPEYYSYVGLIPWLTAVGETMPPWWSKARDAELRRHYKNSDHLSGTVYTLRDMLKTIPWKILPKDGTIKAHHRLAEKFTELILNEWYFRGNTTNAGYDIGFGSGMEDYHTQDNGFVIAIEGPGKPDGPLTGMPTRLYTLDSYRCQRTGHPEYPIIYTDTDGKMYKIYRSRLMVLTSMSAPIADMYGVGFCAVSRCLHISQSLIDNARYKEEKMGSRPRRAILTVDNASPQSVKTIEAAMMLSDEAMDNIGLSKFARIPVIGLKTGQTMSLFDLASIPDGFNNVDDTQLGMSLLALAFGVDVRQLAFALGITGQTKADAEIQNIKMQGKGPGSIIQEVRRAFMTYLLPPTLQIIYDYQDDMQDERVADIKKKRSERHEKDINDGAVSIRVVREQMVEDGDLTPEQFVQLELDDGRLEDGLPLASLFQSNDEFTRRLIGGITDMSLPEEVEAQRVEVLTVIQTVPNSTMSGKARAVLALLDSLKPEKAEPMIPDEPEPELPEPEDIPPVEELPLLEGE